jgi:Fic family protein
LISFWLVERGILRKPLLYMSLYFKENRDEYIDRLQAIRDDGDWEGWLAFFVDGVGQVATEATETATRILELRESDRARIAQQMGRRSGTAKTLLDDLFKRPVASVSSVVAALGVSKPTASALVRDMTEIGLLHELTGRQRSRLFSYQAYLDLFPGVTARE